MPKVSIIVPIYNSEMHLSRCIDSILAQTFIDFELILINDGSNDNSGKLCDNYATKDKRIIVIHKENGGTSSARNSGLEIAKGEYITFVDSDDTISTDYLSTFTYKYDLEIAGLETIEKNPEIDFPNCDIILDKKIDIYNWFSLNSHRKYLTSICCKLFRRNIIELNRLRFNLSLTYGEDTIYIYNYLSHCKNISLLQNVIYQYHVNSDLWSHKYSLSANDCVNHILALTQSLNNIEEWLGLLLSTKQKTAHYPTYLHLFYTHLKSIHEDEKISELKIFRDNSNKLQLWQALNIKDYIYWQILPIFPSLQSN